MRSWGAILVFVVTYLFAVGFGFWLFRDLRFVIPWALFPSISGAISYLFLTRAR